MAFSSRDLGIDLGTSTTIIYSPDEDKVLFDEPSVIAYDKYTGDILATGTEADAMVGKAPRNIEVVKPLQEGVISDFDMTAEMLQIMIRKALADKKANNLRVVVGVPSKVTEVERRAVEEVVREVGGREVYIIDEPMAAAIGAGLDVEAPDASMIVDVGGGTTDIAIISLGGIVANDSPRFAGDKMTDAIITHIRHKKRILLGTKSADVLKKEVGSADIGKDESGNPNIRETIARGRDLASGLPKTFTVTNEDMVEALKDSIDTIVDSIKATVEKSPPDIAADIAEKGLILTGGASLLENFDKLIADKTGMIVMRAENPYQAVAMGAGKSLENVDKLKAYADIKIREED